MTLFAILALALAACGGEDPTPSTPPPVEMPAIAASQAATESALSAPSETEPAAGEEAVATAAPYSGPAICPQGGGDSPEIEPASFDSGAHEHFQAQILDYLNQVGSAEGLAGQLDGLTLQDGSTTWLSTSNVFTFDITGDDVPEVLVDLVFYVSGQYADGGVYIFGCSEEEYVTIDASWLGGSVLYRGGSHTGIVAVEDFSGDGVPEIVTSWISAAGTAANYHRAFEIRGWDGKQFQDLLFTSQADLGVASVENGEGEIIDVNDDGLPELVLRSKVGGHPDTSPLARNRTAIWGWDGLLIALQCDRADSPPKFRYQAIMDGDDATLCGDYDAALALYQQAIFDEELKPGTSRYEPGVIHEEDAVYFDALERANLSAYGRYRILLLHAARGFLPEAQIVYDSLQEQFPEGADGHAYAAMATAFWDGFSDGDVFDGCGNAHEYADQNRAEILSPIGRREYGWPAPDICPGNALFRMD